MSDVPASRSGRPDDDEAPRDHDAEMPVPLLPTTTDLLAQYASTLEELYRRGVVRSTNNPVADYSEYLASRALGLKLAGQSASGYDAVDTVGRRYQVKGRRLTSRNKSRQLSFFRGFSGAPEPFDFLVGILYRSDFSILRAALVPVSVVRAIAVRVEHVNAWRVMLAEGVWDIPGVEDLTERIRAAALAADGLAPKPAEGGLRVDTSSPATSIEGSP